MTLLDHIAREEHVEHMEFMVEEQVGENLMDLRFLLDNKGWTTGTSYYDEGGNLPASSSGQCAITALLVKKIHGGDIIKGKVGTTTHYWNEINGVMIDLTSDQFAPELKISYSHRVGPNDLYNNIKDRYQLMLENITERPLADLIQPDVQHIEVSVETHAGTAKAKWKSGFEEIEVKDGMVTLPAIGKAKSRQRMSAEEFIEAARIVERLEIDDE